MAECADIVTERCASASNGPNIERRKYQEVLSEIGTKRNIIVCLPTGSGKTMIAINIMNSPEITDQVQRLKKKIVFIVTTVQLAEQQAGVISRYTPYKPLICTGASTKSSSWTEDRWKLEMLQNNAFVMIAQICYDKLLGNFLNFNRIALLVLDECHNATKRHKMNEIMGLYHKFVETSDTDNKSVDGKITLPRILGLTATINKQKVKDISADTIANEIAILEARMDCKAVIYDDMDEVQRFSTAESIIKVLFEPEPKVLWGDMLQDIQNLRTFIAKQSHKSPPVSGIMRQALNLNLPNFSVSSTFKNKSEDYQGELNRIILDFEEIFNDLGPLACSEMVQHKTDWLNKLSMKIQDKRSLHVLNMEALKTQFELFLYRVESSMSHVGKEVIGVERIKCLISHKLEILLDHLLLYREKEGTVDELLGLIFVKRRSYAKAIKTMVKLFAENDPDRYGFLKPDIITGTNNNRQDNKDMRVSGCQQKQIIESFRRRDVNLIICTTVLEEGIDVPLCNLVIRFDEIQAYTSFIQSKGRARKQGARFLVFIPITNSAERTVSLNKFLIQQQTMTEVLQSQMKDDTKNCTPLNHALKGLMRPNPEEDFDLEELIPDFCPVGSAGAKITASSAIPLVFMYVQKVEHREIVSWWCSDKADPKEPRKKFRAYVYISEKTTVIGPIEGPRMPCIETAKKAAFMQVCQQLYYSGCLGPHLLPR